MRNKMFWYGFFYGLLSRKTNKELYDYSNDGEKKYIYGLIVGFILWVIIFSTIGILAGIYLISVTLG